MGGRAEHPHVVLWAVRPYSPPPSSAPLTLTCCTLGCAPRMSLRLCQQSLVGGGREGCSVCYRLLAAGGGRGGCGVCYRAPCCWWGEGWVRCLLQGSLLLVGGGRGAVFATGLLAAWLNSLLLPVASFCPTPPCPSAPHPPTPCPAALRTPPLHSSGGSLGPTSYALRPMPCALCLKPSTLALHPPYVEPSPLDPGVTHPP